MIGEDDASGGDSSDAPNWDDHPGAELRLEYSPDRPERRPTEGYVIGLRARMAMVGLDVVTEEDDTGILAIVVMGQQSKIEALAEAWIGEHGMARV